MIANSHHTGTLEAFRRARFVRFGWAVGLLIVGLVLAGVLAGLVWSQDLAQYPYAERQEAQFQIWFGSLSQQSSYQTSDDLPQVLSWYTQHFDLGHDLPQGDSCVTMTRMDPHLFLQESLAVTLCTQPKRTLIFVNRTLALH